MFVTSSLHADFLTNENTAEIPIQVIFNLWIKSINLKTVFELKISPFITYRIM